MRAVTVVPGTAGSLRVEEVPEPDPGLGSVLVEALAVGICGTDAEIAEGGYGWPPPGRDRLILGHESLGRVVDPGPSGLRGGRARGRDRAPAGPGAVPELRGGRVGHVLQRRLHRAGHQGRRRVHGRALADRAGVRGAGGSRAGRARGAAGADHRGGEGLGAHRQHRAAHVLGPAHGAGRRRRADRPARRAVAVQHGAEVHVLDRVESGPKPALVEQLGATYHTGAIADIGLRPDIVLECTGVVDLSSSPSRACPRRDRLPPRGRPGRRAAVSRRRRWRPRRC